MVGRNVWAACLSAWGLLAVGCQDAKKPGDEASQTPAQRIAAALAQLSPEDRVLAEKQRICPVGGGALGSMGAPGKTVVKGRTVFVCCEGCLPDLEKDPEKYLAKLDAAASSETAPANSAPAKSAPADAEEPAKARPSAL